MSARDKVVNDDWVAIGLDTKNDLQGIVSKVKGLNSARKELKRPSLYLKCDHLMPGFIACADGNIFHIQLEFLCFQPD